MSIKYESFDARNSTFAYESTHDLHGYEDGGLEFPAEMVLALSGDEAALIHGTPFDILRLLDSARASVVAHLDDQHVDEGDQSFRVTVELDAEGVTDHVSAARYARDFLLKYAPGLIYNVEDWGQTFVVDLSEEEPGAGDSATAPLAL